MFTPLAAPVVDAAALAEEVIRARLVAPDRLTELLAEFPGGEAAGLAELLVARGVLTPFQADLVLAGESRFLCPGPYRLTGEYRPGTLGLMYRATHVSKPGEFAVKVLPLRSLWQAKQAKQLARSFGRLAAHPRVVPLADADSAKGVHFLVWPLTDDELLADRIGRGGPLTPEEAATVLADLAGGLAACHARGLVHGLLTARAVGLGSDGRARLLEFGAGQVLAASLAADESLFDTLSATLAVTGMLDYTAPELLADAARPTAAADRYALGVVGFVALTGRLPFPDGALARRLLARHAAESPLVREVNPEVPVGLARVVDRLLRPNPAERFDTADEVRDRLVEAREQMDPSRAVLVTSDGRLPGAGSAVDSAHALDAAPAAKQSGTVGWSATSRAVRRDDSDASITFDLPAEPPPDAPNPAAKPLAAVDTPRAGRGDTQPSTRSRRPSLMIEAGLPAPVPGVPPPAGPAPAPPNTPSSPAKSDPPTMAKPTKNERFGTQKLPPPSPKPADPRLTMPKPVQWHTAADTAAAAPAPPEPAPPEPAPADSVLWKRVKRNFRFWQAAKDTLWVSVFGPPGVTPGQTIKLTVYLHQPDAAAAVRTLARAFQHDAELIGTGMATGEVVRDTQLAVHLSVTNAAASKSLVRATWLGQPHRIVFDLHVPWESPAGPAPGLISVGQENVRVGKAPFSLHILPRKG
jgi:serine/threonine protein kinase